jgi:ribosomal protein S18 acetylase RimI-like enzyme
MQTGDVALTFEEIVEADLPALAEVMTRAFDDDSQKHLGIERGGPEGYDNGDFFRKWLFGYEESVGYKILADDKIIGAMIVWTFDHGKNVLGTIFVDPAYQDRGVGTRAWQFVEAAYPDTQSWTLETPCWAKKNHHFYEKKCGFSKVGEKDDSFVYHKDMRTP